MTFSVLGPSLAVVEWEQIDEKGLVEAYAGLATGSQLGRSAGRTVYSVGACGAVEGTRRR